MKNILHLLGKFFVLLLTCAIFVIYLVASADYEDYTIIIFCVISLIALFINFLISEGSSITDAISYILTLKHRDVAKIDKDKYTLYNKNVILTYNKNYVQLFCCNIKNGNSFHAVPEYYNNFYVAAHEYIRIMRSFTYDTTYKNIMNYLEKQNFNIIEDYSHKDIHKDKIKNPEVSFEMDIKVDINHATEKEIATLPGINLINAKKLVKYRDLYGGFKTKEEFFKQINLKQHFVDKIEKMIVISDYYSENKKTSKTDERKVDF